MIMTREEKTGLIGQGLKSSDIKEGKIPTEKCRPNAKFAWSTGVAISRFLEELKKGKIIASTCNKCRRIMVPPRTYCEQCFKATDGWRYVKDTGTINTYSISYLAADASRLEKPILVAIIDLDGASKGMGIIHKLEEVEPEKIRFGMKVRAVWKPQEERVGAITDIKYFKPSDAEAIR
jgi:uncharacterized OB-fold protein